MLVGSVGRRRWLVGGWTFTLLISLLDQTKPDFYVDFPGLKTLFMD